MDLYTIRKKLNEGLPLTEIQLRVTDYARVSTDHKEQQKSLQNQVEHFEDWILSNPNWIYIGSYIDDGISGTTDIKRENFMKMIEDAHKGKFDLVITKEISRFSRNTLDSIKYTRELLSLGVAVLFVNDNINTALPDAELRLTIMASMAQDEIRRLSERVKFGMNRAIERGEILGNQKLYGYRKIEGTKNFAINETEDETVKKIFNLYGIEKKSLSKIAKILNEESEKSRIWSATSVARLIENPKYKGFYCGRKTEVVDFMTKKVKYKAKEEWISYEYKERIPAIVDKDLWEKANARLQSRKKVGKKKIGIENRYPYSGKIFCQKENSPFYPRNFERTTKKKTWVCKTYLEKGKQVCNSPKIREVELNEIMTKILEKEIQNLQKIKELLLPLYLENTSLIKIETKIKQLKKEKKEREEKKKKILELNLEKYLSNREFSKLNREYNKEIKEIEEKIRLYQKNKLEKRKDEVTKNQLINEIDQKINDEKRKEAVISFFLKRILVSQEEKKIGLKIVLSKRNRGKEKNKKNAYIFTRGENIKNTKRYQVVYNVTVEEE